MRVSVLSLCFILIFHGRTNTQSPISFYPYAAGNVWQYRDCVTNDIVYTRYNDTTWVSNDSAVYIRGRVISEAPVRAVFEKIDTTYNVFNLMFQPDYPRYKLAADSGESWIAGNLGSELIRVTLTDVYQDYVFGIITTIKVFTFESVPEPPGQPFWLGDEHMASEFGLVFALIEPSACVFLDAAIIDGVHWGGPILNIPEVDLRPKTVTLYQNYPNPFNCSTTIGFMLSKTTKVSLKVYDPIGRLIWVLLDETKDAGTWSVKWNPEGLSSGTYYIRLEAADYIEVIKVLLIR